MEAAAAAAQPAAAAPPAPTLSDLDCAICLETLHKPCVNHCGHAFCFWCFHQAMGVSSSQCPLCRAEIKHFAAICLPLHGHISTRFAEAAAAREEQTCTQEREEFSAESPAVALPAATGAAAFACGGCNALAAPPGVLPCGHVVCASAGWTECPVQDCVGRAGPGGVTACSLLEQIVAAEHPEEYRQRRESGCAAAPPAPQAEPCPPEPEAAAGDKAPGAEGEAAAGAEPAMDPADMVGAGVQLHSLGSEAGQLLNGVSGTVKKYDAAAGRLLVEVHPPAGPRAWTSRRNQVRVRPKNAKLLWHPDRYTHFGRGCDGCGVSPIVGRCYRCLDCSEEIGYDLCSRCLELGVHKREAGSSGRFNQAHQPDHKMEEVGQEDTVLHQLQRQNPQMSVEQIMALVHAQMSAAGEPQ